jgi:DNA-binding NtrC family response regulator
MSPRTLEKSLAGLSILIVDDEPLIRWAMAETLTAEGHSVWQASDAKETLERLSAGSPPDVIFLDYHLPDANNMTLLATIRRVVPKSSVIMMSAYGTPDVQADAFKLGAYCVVSKPFEMCELAPLVRQASESSHRT